MKLKANKALKYNTRRLLPGDVFEVESRRDYRLLLATKRVSVVRDPVDVPAPPPAVAAKIAAAVSLPAHGPMPADGKLPPPPVYTPPTDDIAAVRAEYVAAIGRQPFMGWDIATLREKIAAAKTS